MINNGKDIRKAMRDAKKEPSKGDPLKGVIYDPRGQYAFPGEITKIQGDAYGTPITMVGVPYPMLGVDDLGNSQMMYPNMEYQFAGQHVTEYPMPPKQYFNAYGGDPSLPALTGHYPFGGMYTKTHTHMQEGGWLDAYDDEYRRGGGVNPLMKARSKRSGTSKNIQSSINKIFLRNKDLFGPGGKNVYDPNSKYQVGGLRAASTTAAVPVSTKAPVNPVNPESTMGLIDFIKHRWNTRDQGPSDWDLGFIDPVTGNYVNTGVTPFDIMLPVQAVSGAKQAVSAVNKLTNSEKLIPKTSTYNKLKSNITNIKELGKGVKETFKEANKTRKFLKENWQDIKQIPDQYKTALKELTSEEGLKRLKELGVDDPDDFINYLKNIKLNTTTEGSHFFPVGPGSVNINPKQVKKLKETILPLSSQKVSIDHELGHAIQYYLENKGKTFNRLTDLDIDAVEALYPHVKENVNKFIEKTRGLTYDEVKKMAENLSESSANYLFRNKREPLSHLRETKRAMVDKGVISNIHETVTPEHIQEFILKGGDKDRILSFLQQTPEAKQTLSKLLNRTPAIIPIGLGVSAISENQKKLGGWLDNLD